MLSLFACCVFLLFPIRFQRFFCSVESKSFALLSPSFPIIFINFLETFLMLCWIFFFTIMRFIHVSLSEFYVFGLCQVVYFGSIIPFSVETVSPTCNRSFWPLTTFLHDLFKELFPLDPQLSVSFCSHLKLLAPSCSSCCCYVLDKC